MKNNCRPQIVRHRRIISLIREGMRSGVYANAGVFARKLAISRATAMRDLDALRDDEGAPIQYDASRKGYYLTDVSWSLPPVRVSRKEVFAFSIAAKLLGAFRGTPLELDMESLFDKIGQSLDGSITIDPSALTEHLSVIGDDYVRQNLETWSAVAHATDRRERIVIVYQKFNGEVKRYSLDPYHLLFYHGNWYVIGMNRTGGRIATFAVSRIRELARTAVIFEPPSGFDIAAVWRDSFGIVRGEKVVRVRLLFSSRVAAYIRERVWHPTQRMVVKRNGAVELTLETGGWNELVRWVLSWQPDVKVLTPKRLRDRVREKMRAGLQGEACCRTDCA